MNKERLQTLSTFISKEFLVELIEDFADTAVDLGKTYATGKPEELEEHAYNAAYEKIMNTISALPIKDGTEEVILSNVK